MKTTTRDHLLHLDRIDSSAILDSLPDGVYITDTDRRILFWNNEAERITGWDRQDVVGHRCHENILCHVDKDGHLLCGHEHCPLHRAIVTEKRSDSALLVYAKRRDGQRIPVEVTVSPIRGPDGKVIGGIEVFRDLSPTFHDLNRARLIQQDTIGLHLPEDPRVAFHVRYVPHDLVGGDFYRGERIDEHRYAILLADVVGHGVPAALYSMQLRSLWEEGRPRLGDPEAFLANLSKRVEPLTDTNAGYFATAVHAVMDARDGTFCIGTAGHPPPVIIRRNGKAETLSPSGPGLGLIPEPVFHVVRGALQKNEHLLFFTDGAYEIMDADQVELGEEALLGLLEDADLRRGEKALSDIEIALLRFSNELALPDDLTLIHLQWR